MISAERSAAPYQLRHSHVMMTSFDNHVVVTSNNNNAKTQIRMFAEESVYVEKKSINSDITIILLQPVQFSESRSKHEKT